MLTKHFCAIKKPIICFYSTCAQPHYQSGTHFCAGTTAITAELAWNNTKPTFYAAKAFGYQNRIGIPEEQVFKHNIRAHLEV